MKKHKNFKKYSIVIVISAIVIAGGVYALLSILNHKTPADTIVYGNIYTSTGDGVLVEAAAIDDGQFVYVGDRAGAEKYRGEETEVLEYTDGMVLAGMSDTHTHVTMDFQTAKDQLDLSKLNSVDEYVEAIKAFIAAHPDNEMYLGMGWKYDLFENETPTKDILDAISKDKPIYLRSSDAHSAWVNSAMLDLAGINKNTENPIGGEIKKDQNGEPVGMVKETVLSIYAKPLMSVYSVEEYKEFILEAQKYYAALGYTAYVEIFIDPDEANTNFYKAYEELDKEGKLSLRVHGAWAIPNDENAISSVEKAIQYKNESAGGMFELTDLKFFMDGVAESHGAFFSEPYADAPETYGMDRWPDEESFNRLVECIKLGNQNGMVAHFHAIGDAAVTKALDAIEAAKKESDNLDVHSVITHLEAVKESDFPRFEQLGVVVAANLSWGSRVSEQQYAMETKLLGEERAEKAYPYKSLADAGAIISYATDYPPGSSALPFGGFSVGISRSFFGNPDTLRDASQQLSRDEALRALTINGAYQMNQDDMRGTIEVGKKADFVIVDTNLLTSLAGKSVLTTVLKTFVDGQEVYSYSPEYDVLLNLLK